MKRRDLFKEALLAALARPVIRRGAGLGLLAAPLAPAIAADLPMGSRQGPRAKDGAVADLPTIRWRLASSFPKSVDAIYGAAERLARRVGEITNGKFQIRPFVSGEIVPGCRYWTPSARPRSSAARPPATTTSARTWLSLSKPRCPSVWTRANRSPGCTAGGGRELMRELYTSHGVVMFPGGNTGVQMGGWFRREIKSLADLKGLKMRIPGIGGQIMARLGVVPQTLVGGDIYPALESGALDATEWVGPYDDEKLGFHKVAKHYYYPGWWEPGPQISFYVNLKKWQELPPPYRAAFEAATVEANLYMLAEYDAKNPAALQRLLRQGVKLHAFPKDVMLAARKTAFEMYEDEARKNATFRRIYVEWKKFAAASDQWFKVAGSSYANFTHYVK